MKHFMYSPSDMDIATALQIAREFLQDGFTAHVHNLNSVEVFPSVDQPLPPPNTHLVRCHLDGSYSLVESALV